MRARGQLVLVTVTSEGTVDEPRVRVDLKPGRVPPGGLRDAKRAVTSLFNLDLDLSPFAKAVGDDPVLSAIARRLRGLKPPRTATLFEALVDSIIEQQISLAAARSIENRVTRTFGETLELEGSIFHAFPSPERLADASPGELRACGLSLKKAAYITDIARGIREGTLDLEGHGPEEDTQAIIHELTTLRGVGPWTAELAVLRGLSRLNAIPAEDLGIRRAISRYYSGASRIDAAGAQDSEHLGGLEGPCRLLPPGRGTNRGRTSGSPGWPATMNSGPSSKSLPPSEVLDWG